MVLAILFDSAGFGEWFVLLAVVLIVVGPKRLPETARTIGRFYSKFRRAAENFKRELLDMDKDMTSIVSDTEKAIDDAFVPEGDESETVPEGDDAGSEADVDYDNMISYGDDGEPTSYGDNAETASDGDESSSGPADDESGQTPRTED